MAVNIEIKQNPASPQPLTIPEIAELKNLSYGVSDNNYSLEKGEIGQYTILYDPVCIGRGIEVSFEDSSVLLRLSLPTTPHEIRTFYELTAEICQKLGVSSFDRDEELIPVSNALNYITYDEEASLNAIKGIDKNIRSGETQSMLVFGALNPITLGPREIDEINNNLDSFEQFLNRLQQKDVFYANPVYYQRPDGSIFGVYFMGEEIVSVVPTSPRTPLCRIENVDSWYVRIPDKNSIPFEDFISHVDVLEYYDHNHIVVSLTESKIHELSSQYTVDMLTKSPCNHR